MAARATASGTISFGLVSIPVKVYTATSTRAVRFNMLDPKDNSRVKQQYVNSASGEVVERGDMVKGYEYARGQYVVVTDDELKALEHKSDRTVEIEEFVPIESIDPVYFDRSNLLGPDKGGAKAYKLLREAMLASGKVAVGRFSTRGRLQLVLIRPTREGLMMHGLFYADEVRSFEDVEIDEEIVLKDTELQLARQLIEQLSGPKFQPDKFEDDYRQAVLEAVDRKVAGEEVIIQPKTEAREQIIDLMAALKKSLADKRGGGAKGAQRKPARAKGKAAGGRG
jgi:DNA end-binding protein Ku